MLLELGQMNPSWVRAPSCPGRKKMLFQRQNSPYWHISIYWPTVSLRGDTRSWATAAYTAFLCFTPLSWIGTAYSLFSLTSLTIFFAIPKLAGRVMRWWWMTPFSSLFSSVFHSVHFYCKPDRYIERNVFGSRQCCEHFSEPVKWKAITPNV